jgi:glycerate 2-kinase
LKILIAPNSFKECANSVEVAKILNWHLKKFHRYEIDLLPLSDGGDGFLQVCKNVFDLELKRFKTPCVYNSGDKFVPVGYSQKDKSVYIEVSDAIGIKNIPPEFRNPLQYNSKPSGVLLEKIYKQKNKNDFSVKKITIGIGGTGTSDLGLGACAVFGLKFIDAQGGSLDVIPGNFSRVKRIILPSRLNMSIELVLDVLINPIGKNGTTYLFAEQKGVKKNELACLESGVKNILNILNKDFGLNLKDEKIGAGGALGVGLSLLANTKIKTSTDFIMKELKLKEKIKKADLVLTGEGNFDRQSMFNKATGIVLNEAILQKKNIVLIAGSADKNILKKLNYDVKVIELGKLFSSREESINKFKEGLEKAAQIIAG